MKNHQFPTSCLGQMLLLVCIYKGPGHLVAEKTESVSFDLGEVPGIFTKHSLWYL